MIKPVSITALFLMTLTSCDSFNKSLEQNTTNADGQVSIYSSVNDSIDRMSENILTMFKTNNYASFSNYLSSEDTVMGFFTKQASKEEISNEELSKVKAYLDTSYPKMIIKTKKNFDFIINKGIQQGIIWKDVIYDRTEWNLKTVKDWSGNSSSIFLGMTILFKYKGVEHRLRFGNEAFVFINSRWLLMEDFNLDDFSPDDTADQGMQNTAPQSTHSIQQKLGVDQYADTSMDMKDTAK